MEKEKQEQEQAEQASEGTRNGGKDLFYHYHGASGRSQLQVTGRRPEHVIGSPESRDP